MRLRSYPSGKTVDKKRRTHCDDKDDNDTDNKVFDHIAGVDFLLVLMRDCDFDADVCAPHDDHRRECHYDIDPERIHKGLKFGDNAL